MQMLNGYILIRDVVASEEFDDDWKSVDDFTEESYLCGAMMGDALIDGVMVKADAEIVFLRHRAITIQINGLQVMAVPRTEVICEL